MVHPNRQVQLRRGYTYTNGDSDAYRNAYRDTDGNRDTDSYSHSYTDGNRDTHCDPNSDSYGNGGASPGRHNQSGDERRKFFC